MNSDFGDDSFIKWSHTCSFLHHKFIQNKVLIDLKIV